MKEQARFWFVHATRQKQAVCLAVAAFTERSARVQTRKRLGQAFTIQSIDPVPCAHAWVLNLTWVAPPDAKEKETA